MSLLPVLRRHIFEPLDALRSGSPRLKYWRELEKTQYLPVEVMKRRQWERFVAMIRFAYECNRFYRELYDAAGVRPEDIRRWEDVLRLPVVTKEDIRNNSSRMISRGFEKQRLLQFKTGGSTGKSLELFITAECSEMRTACARRDRKPNCCTNWWSRTRSPKCVRLAPENDTGKFRWPRAIASKPY